MDPKKNVQQTIDLKNVISLLLKNKKLFFKLWAITFVLSCIWILPQPRYYTTTVSIAPESSDLKAGGSLSSLASSFGMNLGGAAGSDAIYPQLYPDLFKSTEFLVGLLDIQIKTKDGSLETDYYTYMKSHQKETIWLIPFNRFKLWFASLFQEEDRVSSGSEADRFNPFWLSREDTEVLKNIAGKIKCNYSRTTEVVTITITDQDPLVSALMADSIKEHLQVYITDYRTKKSRIDYYHYENLMEKAKTDYEEARRNYATYADSNQGVLLQSVQTQIDNLEKEMELKYGIYTKIAALLENAKSKVQENTPAFTTLTNATVPVKPSGPKRMIFVAVMLFLSTIGTVFYLLRKQLKEWF